MRRQNLPSLRLRERLHWHIKNATAPFPDASPRREVYLAMAELLRRAEGSRSDPQFLDLSAYELKVFSQNGEDGVLDEILRRIGKESKVFVEFGTESGVEANCVFLADVAGWRGYFLEASEESYAQLAAKYETNARVVTANTFVTPDNVEGLFDGLGVPPEFDVLSIEVDNHDYWIWRAITHYRPRGVIVEYNSALPAQPLVVPEDSDPAWDGTDYFGASISALRELAEEKGYRLVHTDLGGANAFFVRADVSGPFPPSDHVPTRSMNFNLTGRRHPPGDGRYVRP